ncbi:hypothetical protein HPP92_015397 [Vanilla planifolia]|uniref:INO80 complex subunit B-like conserved region domain-containing protein n=1 Tax=Vanilla planifolia TaxID=51239 RepID=A0A835QRB9_VANPL|nr:hypothetical protein HPP92_015397 [Vanilla planifolia]
MPPPSYAGRPAGSGQPASSVVKKKRSSSVRRPRQGSPLLFGSRDPSSLSSTSSDNTAKLSRDDSSGYDGSSRRKEIYLNKQHPKVASLSKIDDLAPPMKNRKDGRSNGEFETHYARSSLRDQGRIGSDVKRSSEGVLGPANWKNLSKLKENLEVNSLSSEQYGQSMHLSAGSSNTLVESKLKKVKLKVGGVTRTIPAKSNVGTNIIGSSSTKPSRSTDGPRPRQKSVPQENFDDSHSPREKGHGETWKDAVGPNSSRGKIAEGILSGRQRAQSLVPSSEPVRKSTRVPKRRVLDGEFDDGEEDDEQKYILRLKTSRGTADFSTENEKDVEEGAQRKKTLNVSKSRSTYEVDGDYSLSSASRDSRKKSRSGRLSDDTDYVEEDEPVSDDAPEEKKRRSRRNYHLIHPLMIEFPDGLPPAPPRKQKHKLSEVEEQAKKAEAAQRRKMQVEKAAKESEAAAIRKILGVDSDKKRAEKEKAQAEKLEQLIHKHLLEAVLDGLWDLVAPFYPPPREKCAGPYCTNPYKYRDSKSNLPLCSLQCYKAIQDNDVMDVACLFDMITLKG